MTFCDLNSDRTDLPLVVVPSMFEGMYEPMKQAAGALESVARVRIYCDLPGSQEESAKRMSGAQVAIIFGIHFSDELLSQVASSVKCLVFGGTGVESYVDLERASELGVQVRNIVHYGDASVAEHAIALMFEVARKVGRMDQSMKAGEWNTFESMDLHGKALGLVGFGGVGRAVASMASGLGMRVCVWAKAVHKAAIEAQGYTYEPNLENLFAANDVVSLHLGLNDATEGMITRAHFASMRPGAIFINTARSQLVERGALETALAEGKIQAGIDVFDQEPLPADSKLRTYSNLVLTPHAAWFADTAVTNIVEQCCKDVIAYFNADPLNWVNASKANE